MHDEMIAPETKMAAAVEFVVTLGKRKRRRNWMRRWRTTLAEETKLQEDKKMRVKPMLRL